MEPCNDWYSGAARDCPSAGPGLSSIYGSDRWCSRGESSCPIALEVYLSEELFLLVDGGFFSHRKKPVMIRKMSTTEDKARVTTRKVLCSPGKIIDIILRKLFSAVVIVVF